uniref:Uncharacterized protein n=1 Tax=Cyprinodon variegatus TaxID=28743 RepID=A0A3Q2GRL0_CYPVA
IFLIVACSYSSNCTTKPQGLNVHSSQWLFSHCVTRRSTLYDLFTQNTHRKTLRHDYHFSYYVCDVSNRNVSITVTFSYCYFLCLQVPQPTGNICGPLVQQMKAGLELLESNLTQTKRIMTMEKEQIAKERDNLNLEAIRLRRDKSTLEKELELSKQSTKDQFSQLLAPVSGVSKALLEKIDSLFPEHLRFQLTCEKQKEHLEQIQSNCTNLSREVEGKLQYYLNIVGDKVSNMQNENNHLKAENWRLSEDYRWCSQNRTSMMNEHKRNGEEVQLKHDQEKERLLMDKMKLNGEIEILKNSVKPTRLFNLRGNWGQYPWAGRLGFSSIRMETGGCVPTIRESHFSASP